MWTTRDSLTLLLLGAGATCAWGVPAPVDRTQIAVVDTAQASVVWLAAAASPKAPFNAAAAKPKPRIKKKFNKAAEPKPGPKEAFNQAAKPPEKPPEPPGKGGGGGKKGGSGDPPPNAQPTPPARPVFKPPSI